MKTGTMKRVLAGFLAILLVVTGIAWDFGETKTAEASETASETQESEYYEIDFRNTTVEELTSQGFSAARFSTSDYTKPEDASDNISVGTYWKSNETSGLQSSAKGADNKKTLLYVGRLW